ASQGGDFNGRIRDGDIFHYPVSMKTYFYGGATDYTSTQQPIVYSFHSITSSSITIVTERLNAVTNEVWGKYFIVGKS
ncbi:hypothetical protein, partial [Gallibacterium salpingitidis]|uniref:hypothetical protein n=1 Tax=Gallibacterium salpingitidis TaxID=505341 RepID=UPI001E5A6D7E